MQSTTSQYHQSNSQLQEELIQINLAKQTPEAFEALYNKYYEQIFRYVYQRMDDIEAARDVVSQVFLKAMNKLPSYEFRGVPFSAWLYRIAYSELNQFFRENSNSRTINVENSQLPELELDDEHYSYSDEHKTALISALSQLSEKHLQFIEFRYFEKRSVKEISDILNISESNVKVSTHRAMKKLQALVIKQLDL